MSTRFSASLTLRLQHRVTLICYPADKTEAQTVPSRKESPLKTQQPCQSPVATEADTYTR